MNQRGVTLLELLIWASVVFFALLGIGSFYVAMVRSLNQGSDQAFLQRQGTLLQEELAQQILSAVGVPPGTCGPAGATSSLRVDRGGGDFRCFYQETNRLFECQFTSSSTACVAGTQRNLLLGALTALRAYDVTFTPVGSESVAISFELRDAAGGTVPMKFGMQLTVRN